MDIQIKQTIENEDILSFLKVIEKIKIEANNSIAEVLKQAGSIKLKPSIFVGLAILKRVIECVDAIKILILTGFERDVAVLLLNLIELRLDLLYISVDSDHAEEWLNHDKEKAKPWKVSCLFNKLYSDEKELSAEKDNYMKFSMIKHGNPVGGFSSFPIEITNRTLIIHNKSHNHNSMDVYIFSCGIELCRTSTAFIDISQKQGFNLNTFKEKIYSLNDELQKLNYANLIKMISAMKMNIMLPEMCKSCVAVPEGAVEITCLLHQVKNDNTNFKCERYKSK